MLRLLFGSGLGHFLGVFIGVALGVAGGEAHLGQQATPVLQQSLISSLGGSLLAFKLGWLFPFKLLSIPILATLMTMYILNIIKGKPVRLPATCIPKLKTEDDDDIEDEIGVRV